MGRGAYYSPILIGFALALLSKDAYAAVLPAEPPWRFWLLASLIALATGCVCQLAMVGSQGAFAQVLPGPGGRSIRGGGAVLGGWLLLLTIALGGATALLAAQPEMTRGVIWLGVGITAAAAIATSITYVWCWPVAQRDFDARGSASRHE
jgi:hypothetical protein